MIGQTIDFYDPSTCDVLFPQDPCWQKLNKSKMDWCGVFLSPCWVFAYLKRCAIYKLIQAFKIIREKKKKEKKIVQMTSCVIARSTSPTPDEHECVDMLHPLLSDNNLPLTSTTPSMPAMIKTTDRPVILYMAPVHKLHHDDGLSPESIAGEGVKQMDLN
uniref:Bestrophin homolog n=1 Tax=Heterorhabditis bacteriophora TaxID=37862 RepID=A0A1I7WXS6_HETBA